MRVRTWQFVNFSGVNVPPGTSVFEPTVDVVWLPRSNRVLVEGVFSTGDENHQVVLQNVVVSEDRAIEVIVGVNRIDARFVVDVGRYVPYKVELELAESHPDELAVVHENERGEEILRTVEENPHR